MTTVAAIDIGIKSHLPSTTITFTVYHNKILSISYLNAEAKNLPIHYFNMRLAYLFLLSSIFSVGDGVQLRAARLRRGDWESVTASKSINSNPLNVPMPETGDTVYSASNKITANSVAILGFAILTGGLLMH